MQTDATETVVTQEEETPTSDIGLTGAVSPDATAEAAAEAEVTPAGQVDDKGPPPDEPKPPWASIDGQAYGDAYDALEHPSFKPVLERRDRDIGERVAAEARGEAEKSFNREEAAKVIDGVSGIIGTALERLGDGNAEGASQLVNRIEQMVAPYGKTFVAALKDDTTAEAYDGAAKFFRGVLKEGLPLKAQHELEDFALKQKSWGPVLAKRDELLRPGIEADIERMKASREEKEAHAEEKSGTKPPVKPEGSGGGWSAKSDNELLLDPSTPIEKVKEIRARQGTGG